MNKKIIFLFIIFICVTSFGQTKNDSIFSNKIFVSIKSLNRDLISKNSEFIVLENKDTLVLTKCDFPKFVYPILTTEKETRNFKYKYKYIASGILSLSPKTKPYLRQWNAPIKVFIDKSFSKEHRIEIEKFIFTLADLNIPNLKIELVKNKKSSNYYITTTNEKLEILDEKNLDRYSDEQVKNKFVDNANYYLTSDKAKKIYACTLKVNTSTFDDANNILVKVKKLFFGSLGRFYPITKQKESLLSRKYENSGSISTYDINLLKTHYNYIYPYKVDYDLFKKLENE